MELRAEHAVSLDDGRERPAMSRRRHSVDRVGHDVRVREIRKRTVGDRLQQPGGPAGRIERIPTDVRNFDIAAKLRAAVGKYPKAPDVRRLVGSEGSYGEQIGLTRDWVVRIIRHVGNYAETCERNVGVKSRLGIPRGINQLWSMGGIQYAPPIR